MIGIINYGLGNVQAFVNIYQSLHVPVKIIGEAEDLEGIKKLVLPGVGAFDHAMRQFEGSGLRLPVEELVLNEGVPVLGVCVGMQMLAQSSEEGRLPGLGWINGRVRSLEHLTGNVDVPLPHMGWNDISTMLGHPMFKGLESKAKFYFLHSYYFECLDSTECLATANYGVDFCCSVAAGNVFGTQFHPEKSHHYGLQLLQNYSDL